MVIPIIFVISLALSKKIKNTSVLILLLLVAIVLHLLSVYLLLPVGWASDQRVFFINSIKNTGKIEALEKYSFKGIYYTRYPIPWLTALSIDLVSMIGPQASWLLTILATYVCFIVFLILICTRFFKMRSLNTIAWIIIVTMTTIYSHRPFQDLIPSSIGVLSLIMVLYLYMSGRRFVSILLLLIIPLLVTHGLSIYFTMVLLFLLAVSSYMTSKRAPQRAVNFTIIVFAGTWFYQVGVQLIDMVVRQIPYRWNQILNAITSPWFERPMTHEAARQTFHTVYWFDNIITPLAFSFPAILTMISTVYFFYKILCARKESNMIMMLFSLTCLFMFLIAGIFSWRAIENAIARYLYVYAAPISILVNASLLHSVAMHKQFSFPRKIGISIVLIALGTAILTESFYTPYASMLSLPDKGKFEQLYQTFYARSMFNLNLASTPVLILEALQRGDVYIHSASTLRANILLYTNGFVVATM
jgi:hypothetical protein